jgi:Ca2+-binding RTX toxin-like protein
MSTLTGTELSDTTLVGSLGDDTIYGLGGDDLITTGTGNDIINAGAGKDTLVVDYSASTTKVTMSAPADTGVVLAGTGFPAPGGNDFAGSFNSDHTIYTATYSNLDLSQADQIWLAVGNSDLTFSGISDDGKTATVDGSYTFSYLGFDYTISYTIAGTLSEGTWALPEDLGVGGADVVHQVGSSSFSVDYAVDIEVPDSLQAVYELVKNFGDNYVADQMKGNFYYDDAGTSGQITDGTSNTVTFDDFENFVITTGAAGSDITTGDGNDTLNGGGGNDTFVAGGGNDTMAGNDGDDVMRGGEGQDKLNGGSGNDTADFSDRRQSISVQLDDSHKVDVKVGGFDEDTIRNIENIIAGSKADVLTGDALDNRLTGNAGNDKLSGGKGDDALTGGGGRDALEGGAGADIFVFLAARDSAGKHVDTIGDFDRKEKDVIDLSAIDAKQATGADDAFHFLATEGAQFKHAGDLTWTFKGNTTVIAGDTDGDKQADFRLVLNGHVTLTENCFDL